MSCLSQDCCREIACRARRLVRTLDAIHLGTALRSGIEDLVVVGPDARMLEVAVLMGFDTFDPCIDD